MAHEEHNRFHIVKAGTTAASTAPWKVTSGTLNTAAEVGAFEFLTDKIYFTITTGAARKEITLNDAALTSGRVPFVTTNGRLTDDADFTFVTDTLTVTKLRTTEAHPTTDDGGTLGSTSLKWSDLFLASGAVVNWNSGDVTLTHATGKLTFGGDGTVEIDFNNHEMTNVDIDSGAIDGTTVGATTPSSGVFTSLRADSITNDTGLASGVYSPTASSATNLDSTPTMSEAQYLRVGNTVTVSGRFTADPTAGAATNFEIDLPVASNIGAVEDVAGVAFCGAIAGQGAAVNGVVANDTAQFEWVAVDLTSQTWSYTFSYQVI